MRRFVIAEIINRGRGPEIAGTRITVYDILDYTQDSWTDHAIAATLRIAPEQVAAGRTYIEGNQKEVPANYQNILARCARGNPPEVQAKLDAIHHKYQELWADRLERTGLNGVDYARHSGGQQRPLVN